MANEQSQISDIKNRHIYLLVKHLLENHLEGESIKLFGISGAGGAGKTTFAGNLTKFLGIKNSLAIDLDDYLISREERSKLEITGYNPRANKLALARANFTDLIGNKAIRKPRYDHSTGKVLSDENVNPNKIVIVEGVTTLYPELREIYDISFFLDASDETQIKSRITRDVAERGYTLDEALELFKATKPDYQRFIEPTKEFADIVLGVNIDYIMTPTHIATRFR